MTGRTAPHPIAPLFLERWLPRAGDGSALAPADMPTVFEAARSLPSSLAWVAGRGSGMASSYPERLQDLPMALAINPPIRKATRMQCRIHRLLLLAMSIFGMSANPATATTMDARGPACDRGCLERVARSYIDGLVAHAGGGVLLAPQVRRTENALTNARGVGEVRDSFKRVDMIERAHDLRFYTDVAQGEVIAFFVLDIDLKPQNGGGSGSTKAGNTEYKVSVTKAAGTYSVHEAERFRIRDGRITEIEIIAHVEDGKGLGSGWPVERLSIVKPSEGAKP